MIKRIIFSLALIVFATNIFASISAIDTSYTDGITAFEWSPISDVDKILQYENQKDISKETQNYLNVYDYNANQFTGTTTFFAVGTSRLIEKKLYDTLDMIQSYNKMLNEYGNIILPNGQNVISIENMNRLFNTPI